MNTIHDRPLAGTCAKGTLLGPTRTGALLIGIALAGLMLVELPLPIGSASETPPYVPASETWIDLGHGSAKARSSEPQVPAVGS